MKDGRDLNPIQIIVHEMTMTEEYLFRPTLQLKSLYIFLQWLHQQDPYPQINPKMQMRESIVGSWFVVQAQKSWVMSPIQ